MGQANLRYIGCESTLEGARSLFLSARSAECLWALGANATPRAAFLRSRDHLRPGEPRRAVDALITRGKPLSASSGTRSSGSTERRQPQLHRN